MAPNFMRVTEKVNLTKVVKEEIHSREDEGKDTQEKRPPYARHRDVSKSRMCLKKRK